MRIRLYIIFLITCLMLSFSGSAQYESRGVEFDYIDAQNFLDVGNYYDALPLFEKLFSAKPKVTEYQYKMGICHLHLGVNPEKSIEFFEIVSKKKNKLENVKYHLARAYALNYKFDLAITTFKEAEISKKTTADLKKEIPHLIEQCNNAIEIIKDSLSVEIVNLGAPINSVDNEYSPTINADESTIIYTYKGPKSKGGRQDEFNRPEISGDFYEDIYISNRSNGVWGQPKSISDSINSELHEGSISLSPDGQKLLVYQDTKEFSGDLFETKKIEGLWGDTKRLSVSSDDWEGHAAISPNGKMMIFSSDRDGSLGGRDLYSAVLQEDTTWGQVRNLGPTINTIYNDDAPFIHSDGVTFNFSSEGHTSMGGYDIFESKIVNDSSYLKPRNIGYPINTTSNDIFFYVSGSGNAYYSSARKGGVGQHDIYVIEVKDIVTSQPVLLVKGVVKTNGDFDVAKITVRTESGKDLGTYYSDLADGKYQFYVDVNDYYVVTYEVEGFPAHIESIDATSFTEYSEIERDVNFLSRDVNVNGMALISENPLSPIMNLKVNISNKEKTFTYSDTTDSKGYYEFKNLPNADEYLLFIDEEDEEVIEDSTYVFKGNITIKGLPYAEANLNGVKVEDDGTYRLEVEKYYLGLLNGDGSVLDNMSSDDILLKFGDQTYPGLKFQVQVGAYNYAGNYDSSHLKGLGEINNVVLDDGITRFTLGELSTLRAAKELQKKAIKQGQEDAFVIMLLEGKRTYLEELVNSKLFK